jgi:hypothetical protein
MSVCKRDQPMQAQAAIFSVLFAALHNVDVKLGNVDEALHQRCVLRCLTHCMYPTPTSDVKHCVLTCRDRCVEEALEVASHAGRLNHALAFALFSAILVVLAYVYVQSRYIEKLRRL